jgi:hypothetical protein
MKPRRPATRKVIRRKHQPLPRQRLFTVRSALVFELALLTAIGGTGLLLAAHRTMAQAVLSGLGILGVALKLFNDLIELRARAELAAGSDRQPATGRSARAGASLTPEASPPTWSPRVLWTAT